MIETRGAEPVDSRVWVSSPLPLARHPPRGSGGHRQCNRIAPSTKRPPTPPASTLVTAPAVPQRSARRATARRASNRRATARLHKDDIEERISDYLNDHPLSTTGDLAKGLNADRGEVRRGAVAHREGHEIGEREAAAWPWP